MREGAVAGKTIKVAGSRTVNVCEETSTPTIFSPFRFLAMAVGVEETKCIAHESSHNRESRGGYDS